MAFPNCALLSLGLNAAESFIERHSEHLQQLDLTVLLRFGPLQDVFNARPELFSSIGQTAIQYLKQAPAEDKRLFIWTLEEHRNHYLSCHTILDEYFEMMGMMGLDATTFKANFLLVDLLNQFNLFFLFQTDIFQS